MIIFPAEHEKDYDNSGKGRMIIIPPSIPPDDGKPIIFLAGPIQGTWEWQSWMLDFWRGAFGRNQAHIAIPRRGMEKYEKDFKFDTKFNNTEQYNWETHYLNRAAENGIIFFWLAKEKTIPVVGLMVKLQGGNFLSGRNELDYPTKLS